MKVGFLIGAVAANAACAVTVELTFSTPETVARGTLRVAPLAGNKRIAASSRWDDTNPAHLHTARVLRENGWKGTFYLVQPNESIIRGVRALGCDIGAHALDHANLPVLNRNEMFRDALFSRIRLEAAADTPVVSMVTPGCAMTLWISGYRLGGTFLGDALFRAGYIGGPEFHRSPWQVYGLSESAWYGGDLVAPGDREPSLQKWEKGVSDFLKAAGQSPFPPMIAAGLHSWHTPLGLERLGDALKKYRDTPDWWYCTNREYYLYRRRAETAKITPGPIDGARRVFTVEFPDDGIGAGLTMCTAPEAAGVKIDGRPAAVRNGMFELPATAPALDRIEIAAADGTLKKFPGIRSTLAVDPAAGRAALTVVNGTDRPFTAKHITLRIPPRWKSGIFTAPDAEIPAGAEKVFSWELGPTVSNAELREGRLYFGATVEDGRGGRFHTVREFPFPAAIPGAPRDFARVLGPCPDTPEFRTFCREQSCPGAAPAAFGDGPLGQWGKAAVEQRLNPGAVLLHRPEPALRKLRETFLKTHKQYLIAVALDFDAPAAGEYRLFSRRDMSALYVNGTELKPEFVRLLKLPAGISRMVAVFPRNGQQHLAVAAPTRDFRSEFLQCREPK